MDSRPIKAEALMQASFALLEKYSKPGPRYTSYPTAPYFSTAFSEADWRAELVRSQASGRDLSLYVHIPFCDSLCYYCGCNMVATQDYTKATAYLDVLFDEIERSAELAGGGRVVRQIHWGGGTPTFLKPADILRLSQHLHRYFMVAEDAEIGCEVDPRELSREHVQALKQAGFNRISLGVQDLDERVQRAVNRLQPLALIEQVYGWMRSEGFNSINMDLMVGLPHQTVASFNATLDEILALSPDRLAVFGYAHVPWLKKHQKLILEPDLPDFATRISLQELIQHRLSEAGYVYIGMDHFARHDDELVRAQQQKTLWRNFQGYTTHRDCDILAFGASAISQTDEVYAQNFKRLTDYHTSVSQGSLPIERGLRISLDDKIRRDAITRIMCDLELDKAVFARTWGLDFDTYFAQSLTELQALSADELVELTPERVRVTEAGRIFLRNIAMTFDAYLHQPQDASPRYSRTV
ncbi:MAG: oxygen-independent coproporphyrinogen III oxidase [Sulfuriferula sp.]